MNPLATAPPSPEQIQRLVVLNRALMTQQLLRGIAHELRNNLQVVALGTSLSQTGAEPSVSLRVDAALDQMVVTIDQLARLGRIDLDEPPDTELGAAIDEAVLLAGLQRHLPDIELTVDRPLGPVVVGMPRGELVQVLANLVANARESGARPADPVLITSTMAMEGRAAVTVIDSGPGIGPSGGGPLASTKNPHTHGGLGLFVSRTLVERYGGTLTWDGASGGGAQVRVVLAVTDPS